MKFWQTGTRLNWGLYADSFSANTRPDHRSSTQLVAAIPDRARKTDLEEIRPPQSAASFIVVLRLEAAEQIARARRHRSQNQKGPHLRDPAGQILS